MARKDRVNKNVTRVEEERNVTTGRLTTIRFTQHEDELFDTLISLVQKKIPNKKISKSRIIRSISYMDDDRFLNNIVQSIKNNC